MKQYEYRPQPVILFLAIAFFGACAGILGYKAATNEVGLILNRIIEMSPDQANIFYWVLCGASVLFVLVGLFSLMQRVSGGKKTLDIHDDYFFVPKQGFIKEKTVKFADVMNVSRQDVSGTITLSFQTNEGKAHVNNRNFKSKAEFEEAVDLLLSRCQK